MGWLTATGAAQNENTGDDGSQGDNSTRQQQVVGDTGDQLLIGGVGCLLYTSDAADEMD